MRQPQYAPIMVLYHNHYCCFSIDISFGDGRDGHLILEENECRILVSNRQYHFQSVILKPKSSLSVDPWNYDKQTGGTLLIHVKDTIHIHKSITCSVINYRKSLNVPMMTKYLSIDIHNWFFGSYKVHNSCDKCSLNILDSKNVLFSTLFLFICRCLN